MKARITVFQENEGLSPDEIRRYSGLIQILDSKVTPRMSRFEYQYIVHSGDGNTNDSTLVVVFQGTELLRWRTTEDMTDKFESLALIVTMTCVAPAILFLDRKIKRVAGSEGIEAIPSGDFIQNLHEEDVARWRMFLGCVEEKFATRV